MARAIVLMGVSGSGKTTVGKAVAAALGYPFYDGDEFHPPENIAKMARGMPLNDRDRAPWLARLRDLIAAHLDRRESLVLACSALKRQYRDQLRSGTDQEVVFVYLHGHYDLLSERLEDREGHYMKPEMLRSQFEALEPPGPDERAIRVDVSGTVEETVTEVLDRLG